MVPGTGQTVAEYNPEYEQTAPVVETVEKAEQTSNGTVVYKKVTCGPKGCHCEDGELHGPYNYRVTYQNGKQKWKSLGPVDGDW